ncbi:Cold shock protein [Rickettsiales endosymbiont of Paramecium tredecaurelia]|uniref:cold-shock protein n=1 Tax=Candidatus Sarmatiella mevalonica TaxID=2770581 RepID=UPI001921D9F2|nr:cold shock domain-containing protein [Candidatus Sarmatiella mevalonica]MBL3284607.1 Cold shock protein [Candidatus Sarmatiella mevalonica]
MDSGRIKWFNQEKGYGFIAPDSGGSDIFLHISAIPHEILRKIAPDVMVQFELVTERGKTSATKISVIDEAASSGMTN